MKCVCMDGGVRVALLATVVLEGLSEAVALELECSMWGPRVRTNLLLATLGQRTQNWKQCAMFSWPG